MSTEEVFYYMKIEEPGETPDETNLTLRELIKAFAKLIYITLYGFKK